MKDIHRTTRHIRVDHPVVGHDGVALLTIDRPGSRNALNLALLIELADKLEFLDGDGTARAVVLTGAGDRAFAAGSDIIELADQTGDELRNSGRSDAWDRIASVGLPVIAAVRGYVLGGGCELAMSCDIIVAGEDARFGQPEIRLGIMPGAGGTQRLPRAVGKALAMDLILTGRLIDAAEARIAGIVARIVPSDTVLDEALALADTIAAGPPLAIRAAKRAVRDSAELPLGEGLRAERDAFLALFDTADQAEGMRAFLDKRPPVWTGR